MFAYLPLESLNVSVIKEEIDENKDSARSKSGNKNFAIK